MRKIFKFLALLPILFFLPWLIIRLQASDEIKEVNDLPMADTAIIFGAHLQTDGQPTEILKERLDAAIVLYHTGKVEYLVVSNTERAAEVMRHYLLAKGVDDAAIEVDPHAEITTNSCIAEKHRHPDGRSLVFLSQGFHLPRLLYLCKGVDVHGVAFPVEQLGLIDRSSTPALTKYKIRTERYLREAALTWAAILHLY